MDEHAFCRAYLAAVRRSLTRPAPRRLSALRLFRQHFLVEGDGGFAVEVEACCAWYARAKALEQPNERRPCDGQLA